MHDNNTNLKHTYKRNLLNTHTKKGFLVNMPHKSVKQNTTNNQACIPLNIQNYPTHISHTEYYYHFQLNFIKCKG